MEHRTHTAEVNDDEGSTSPRKRHHAVIAGTGRAGTSFLVQFLDRCGLETNLSGSSWFAQARAGHEHALDGEGTLPYVVKDPVLFTYCADLDLAAIQIDVLIVPVRDLMLAARSRVHQERLAIADNPWLQRREVQHAGTTPGGILYSLDVVDQARILAVGFHRLIHWAIVNEIPLLLPEFPRLVEDREYALRTLWPWLGGHCSLELARSAFAETADVRAVRIKHDCTTEDHVSAHRAEEPDPDTLDRAVLSERLQESRATLALAQSDLARASTEGQQRRVEIERLHNSEAELRSQLQGACQRIDQLESALAAHHAGAQSASTAPTPPQIHRTPPRYGADRLQRAVRRATRLAGRRRPSRH